MNVDTALSHTNYFNGVFFFVIVVHFGLDRRKIFLEWRGCHLWVNCSFRTKNEAM